ncbi:MAG: TetR/AcrR family transcriptional regulator [Candidatus Eremiobacteraeota bacterium]|nr:TetR/AcrR family transcriptional regulator [Candidatus Eremiobacteraeota bacterium]
MPAALIPRDEVVRRLFDAFRTFGYEGATLARLSEATGLGRASLYHYFPEGKDGMAREVIALAREWIKSNVNAPLVNVGEPATSRLKTALRNVANGYDNGRAACLINIFGIGDANDVVREALRETASLYSHGFERLLLDAGVQKSKAREISFDTVIQIEGALVLARALDDRSVFTKRIQKLEKQYLELIG